MKEFQDDLIILNISSALDFNCNDENQSRWKDVCTECNIRKGRRYDGTIQSGYCYQLGIGISKVERKASKWYLKAAKNGNSDDKNNSGWNDQGLE